MHVDLVKSVKRAAGKLISIPLTSIAAIALWLFYNINSTWNHPSRAAIESLSFNKSVSSSQYDQYYNLLGLSHPLDNKDFRLDDQFCYKGLIGTYRLIYTLLKKQICSLIAHHCG
jgi:hypothetical protein